MLNAVVIIYQRSVDIPSSIYHSWLYQSLIGERFKLRFNKATDIDNSAVQFDLDFFKDKFWQNNFDQPFPIVTDNFEKETSQLKRDTDSMRQAASSSV